MEKKKAEKTPKKRKPAKTSRTSSIAKTLSMTKVMDKLQLTLKNLIEIGLLDDLTVIVKAVSDNKENLVELFEKGTSLAFESNKLLADNKDQVASIIVNGEKSVSQLTESIGPILSGLASITGLIENNSDKIASVIEKADHVLDQKEDIQSIIKDAGILVGAAAEKKEDISAIIENLGTIVGALADQADDIKDVIANAKSLTGAVAGQTQEMSNIISQSDAITKTVAEGADDIADVLKDSKEITGSLAKEIRPLTESLPGLSGGLRFLYLTLSRLLPKLEGVNEKSLDTFMMKKGIRVFIRSMPKL